MAEIPFKSSYLPPEYGQQLFEDVAAADDEQQTETMRRFIEGINAIGKTYTGSALRSAITGLLGPESRRKSDVIRKIAIQGAETGARERQEVDQWGRQVQEADRGRAFTSAENEKSRAFTAQQNELNRRASKVKKPSFLSTLTNAAMGVAGNMATGGLTSMLGGLPSLLGVKTGAAAAGPVDAMPTLSSAYPEDNMVMRREYQKPKQWWEY